MLSLYLLASAAIVEIASAQSATSPAPPSNVLAAADPADTILADQHFTWPNVPYKVNPYAVGRGPQTGYNLCNSTTLGPDSQCQTSWLNSVSDFCLWGPSTPNTLISDSEAATIAWCTQATHGTRVMPAGTITAVQFLRAPGYIQVTGLLNQVNIDMTSDDGGGELDPHGADGLGNPLGGLVFSNGLSGSENGTITQVSQWHNFMGSGQFCFKACDPAVPSSYNLCQNIYDRIGCDYNAPAAYEPGVFESCLSDDQDPPGVYTGADGQVTTYHQPGDATPIDTLPYTARIPASSSCTTFASSVLFAGAPAASSTASGSVTGSMVTTTGGIAKPTGTTSSAAKSTASSSSSGAQVKYDGVTFGATVVMAVGGLVGAILVL